MYFLYLDEYYVHKTFILNDKLLLVLIWTLYWNYFFDHYQLVGGFEISFENISMGQMSYKLYI